MTVMRRPNGTKFNSRCDAKVTLMWEQRVHQQLNEFRHPLVEKCNVEEGLVGTLYTLHGKAKIKVTFHILKSGDRILLWGGTIQLVSNII